MESYLNATDATVLKEVGQRLGALRVARNLTQRQLAEQAGLGLRTVQRLELGEAGTHLSGFVRVCRMLGLLERLDAFIPPPVASPIAQLKSQGRQRKRASGRRAAMSSSKPWTWGDSP